MERYARIGKRNVKRKTYDITLAGPRNRFALANGAIVSNSGKLVQPHNFIRGKLKIPQIAEVFELLATGDWRLFELIFEWPIDRIAQVMRGFIKAGPGKMLYVVDYSSIEARVLVWLAQQHDVLDTFFKGADPYRVMASKLYNKPYESVDPEGDERRIGKNLVLGCGYGLGAAKFVEYSEKAGTEITPEFAKIAVKAYRDANPKVVQFWNDVEQRAIAAVRDRVPRERKIKLRNLAFFLEEFWLVIELPGGRELRYFKPRVKLVEKWGHIKPELSFMADFRGRMYPEQTYGGKLVENIVQAVARDLMVNGMFEAESECYPVIGTVHDELITEPDKGFGDIHELEQIVCRAPTWAKGLPIAAKGFVTERYRK